VRVLVLPRCRRTRGRRFSSEPREHFTTQLRRHPLHRQSVARSEDFQEAFKALNTPYLFFLIGVAPPDMYAKAQAAGLQYGTSR
jgi:hypothetical protein